MYVSVFMRVWLPKFLMMKRLMSVKIYSGRNLTKKSFCKTLYLSLKIMYRDATRRDSYQRRRDLGERMLGARILRNRGRYIPLVVFALRRWLYRPCAEYHTSNRLGCHAIVLCLAC